MDHKKIEKKWQKKWKKARLFEPEINKKKPFYIQVAYPYPSGAMHIGHARTYSVVDIILRYKRMKGFNVLMPMGWHVSGTPVIAGVELIKRKDEKAINTMIENFKIPKSDLKELETPESFVNYFVNKAETGYKEGFKRLGMGIDWRRELTTMDKQYNKFVEWQYRKLYNKGYIVKGKYPVRYCPFDKNPVGDHDVKEGKGLGIQEFTLLKFKFNDRYLVAATLRPETIYGQTNLWVNPDLEYAIVLVDDEEWVMSEQCYNKLQYQKKGIEKVGSIFGKELIGKYCNAPGINRKIIILPSFFCDPNIGTGIVTSVPSDSPADYMGLYDLQKNDELAKDYNLNYSEIKKIKVIPIIKTKRYGDMAAVKICEEMNIKNQFDMVNLEKAKKIVYKEGFHLGIMNENCGKYKGMKVEKAKDLVKKDLIKNKEANIFYELEGRVVCYCNSECVVQILDDQWFVKYSDKKWKEESKETLKNMEIVPELFRLQYENVFDWLEDKPCTRAKGLGTRFPWDMSKIIEPLGDSTIYMTYFTFSHIIKKINAEKLDDSVFDYIFLGKGDVNKIAKERKIKLNDLKEMRENFNYWYPLMFNASALELIPNHMSFSIFQHTAIFPKNKRQKGTLNLGMLIIDGVKMASSKGNVVLINDLTNKIGADYTRFFLMNFVEPWQEANWKSRNVEVGVAVLDGFVNKLNDLAKKVKNAKKISNLNHIEKWIISKFNSRLKIASEYIGTYELRKFLQEMCFSFMADFRKFERKGKGNNAVYRYLIENWVRVMSPFMPHVCEEIWSNLGNKNFVCLEKWPEIKMIDKKIEIIEENMDKLVNDIRNVMNLAKIEKPSNINLIVADKWKYDLFKELRKIMDKGKKVEIKDFLVKGKEEEIAKIVNSAIKDPSIVSKIVLNQGEEIVTLMENANLLREEFKCEIDIEKAEKSGEEKRRQALPGKSSIVVK